MNKNAQACANLRDACAFLSLTIKLCHFLAFTETRLITKNDPPGVEQALKRGNMRKHADSNDCPLQ